MTRIVTILADGFADWETTLLNAVAHAYYQVETHYATPGKTPVTSMGGLMVMPDMAIETIRPDEFDAVIVCGGTAWKSDMAPDIAGLLMATRNSGTLLGLICDGTWPAAKAGILDDIDHTSNGAGYLDDSGYAGSAHYRDTPAAVVDGRVITASGTSPVAFMAAVMQGIGVADENLPFFVGLHAAQYQTPA
jgi:putative intracellular protease/amidase